MIKNVLRNTSKTLLYISSFIYLLCVCNFSQHLKKRKVMYLGECPKIKDGRQFHGNEAWGKKIILLFSPYFFILIIINVQRNECVEK